MARHETDREDLLREATALVERIELQIAGFPEPIVCGFRRDGCASFYFGGDPVYQFNTSGQLRRAFVSGRVFKAEQGRLVALSRERLQHESALIRHELAADEFEAVLNQLSKNLSQLHQALQSGSYAVHGQVPADANITGRILAWLKNLPARRAIAAVPNAR